MVGYRSIEIECVNRAPIRLLVHRPLAWSGCRWISGATPKQGDVIAPGASVRWGVYTDEPEGAASAHVELIGARPAPLRLDFGNPAHGLASCTTASGDQLQGAVSLDPTRPALHALFVVEVAWTT